MQYGAALQDETASQDEAALQDETASQDDAALQDEIASQDKARWGYITRLGINFVSESCMVCR